jgi:hypothetical protein
MDRAYRNFSAPEAGLKAPPDSFDHQARAPWTSSPKTKQSRKSERNNRNGCSADLEREERLFQLAPASTAKMLQCSNLCFARKATIQD